jgi:hypothetical protein
MKGFQNASLSDLRVPSSDRPIPNPVRPIPNSDRPLPKMISHRFLTMSSVFPRFFFLVALLLSPGIATPAWAQDNDMFPTKAAALQRAKELKCTGAFAMGNEWMPCKDFGTYEKAVRKDS